MNGGFHIRGAQLNCIRNQTCCLLPVASGRIVNSALGYNTGYNSGSIRNKYSNVFTRYAANCGLHSRMNYKKVNICYKSGIYTVSFTNMHVVHMYCPTGKCVLCSWLCIVLHFKEIYFLVLDD